MPRARNGPLEGGFWLSVTIAKTDADKMKIVLIVIDCLRADSVAPGMQAFLDSGREYVNAFAAGPSTIPAVPTFLTGVPAGQHGLVTAGHQLKMPTIAQRLRDRGFKTIGYSANNLASLPRETFDEWVDLRWMSSGFVRVGKPLKVDPYIPTRAWDGKERLKATQESYEDVWEDIRNRKGDLFAYVHLNDVHEPFRRIPGVALKDFKEDYRTYRLIFSINHAAKKGGNALTPSQWIKLRKLYDAEVDYLDKRLEYPGDLTIFTADHGQMLGEEFNKGRWFGHPAKMFIDATLRVPLGIRGLGPAGEKEKTPFHLMYLPALIDKFLDGKKLPKGDTLYWEDYWYNCASFAMIDRGNLTETLVLHSTGEVYYRPKKGKPIYRIAKVPDTGLWRPLACRIAQANQYPWTYGVLKDKDAYTEEEQEIILERLRGQGYLQ